MLSSCLLPCPILCSQQYVRRKYVEVPPWPFNRSAVDQVDAPHLLVALVIAESGIGQAFGTTGDRESGVDKARYHLKLLRGTMRRYSSDDVDALKWLDLWHKVEAGEALEVLAHAYM